MAKYYLASSEELYDNNVAVIKEGERLAKRLETALKEHLDNETVKVLKAYSIHLHRIIAECSYEPDEDGEIKMFNVELNQIWIY